MESNEGSDALGFESDLWASANKLRGSMDAAEYKHVVLPVSYTHLTLPTTPYV